MLGTTVLRRAGDGIRTRDPRLGRVMLYQLSYSRIGRWRLPAACVNVGREGFEPPYSYENRFTVCRL